jgi:hypothetical protein
MLSCRIKKLAILLGVVLYGLFACCSLVETVICYGVDGHVNIETASNHCSEHLPDCQSQDLLAYSSASFPFPENDHCGSCSDIPLSTGKPNLSLAVDSCQSLQIQPVVACVYDYLESTSSSIIRRSFSDQSDPALNIIKTTILLI